MESRGSVRRISRRLGVRSGTLRSLRTHRTGRHEDSEMDSRPKKPRAIGGLTVKTLLFVPLLLLSAGVVADDSAPGAPAAGVTVATTNGGPKTISGMSILGNQ